MGASTYQAEATRARLPRLAALNNTTADAQTRPPSKLHIKQLKQNRDPPRSTMHHVVVLRKPPPPPKMSPRLEKLKARVNAIRVDPKLLKHRKRRVRRVARSTWSLRTCSLQTHAKARVRRSLNLEKPVASVERRFCALDASDFRRRKTRISKCSAKRRHDAPIDRPIFRPIQKSSRDHLCAISPTCLRTRCTPPTSTKRVWRRGSKAMRKSSE